MKLYGIIYAYYAGSGVDAYSINEEGRIIDHHFCSSEGFAKSDLGFSGVYLPSSETFNDQRKKKYSELGYTELIWLGFQEDDFSNDLRDHIYNALLKYNEYRQIGQDSVKSISTMAEQNNLVILKNGIDWAVEKSELPVSELKIKNAYVAGLLWSKYSSISFADWSNEYYSNIKQLSNG